MQQSTLVDGPTIDDQECEQTSADILGCAIDGCDYSCESLQQLNGHYISYHHPDADGSGTNDEDRVMNMVQFYHRLEEDVKTMKPLVLPF